MCPLRTGHHPACRFGRRRRVGLLHRGRRTGNLGLGRHHRRSRQCIHLPNISRVCRLSGVRHATDGGFRHRVRCRRHLGGRRARCRGLLNARACRSMDCRSGAVRLWRSIRQRRHDRRGVRLLQPGIRRLRRCLDSGGSRGHPRLPPRRHQGHATAGGIRSARRQRCPGGVLAGRKNHRVSGNRRDRGRRDRGSGGGHRVGVNAAHAGGRSSRAVIVICLDRCRCSGLNRARRDRRRRRLLHGRARRGLDHAALAAHAFGGFPHRSLCDFAARGGRHRPGFDDAARCRTIWC